MIVNSRQAAWAEADRLFPTDYIKNDRASKRAGYDIYYSTSEGNESWISDLGNRLEVNVCDKKGVMSFNIWIDEKPEIEEEEVWHASDVRHLCIKNEWYTRGDNKAYSAILDMVDESEPTTANIYKVAKDIKEHSSTDYEIENIMFELKKWCVTTFYTIIEE